MTLIETVPREVVDKYVNEVEAFLQMLRDEYEMKHKIPLCPKNEEDPTEHNWDMDGYNFCCVDCGFVWGKPLNLPRAKNHFEWRKVVE
jgi:hypothetical protein